jgi:hypothetical protein
MSSESRILELFSPPKQSASLKTSLFSVFCFKNRPDYIAQSLGELEEKSKNKQTNQKTSKRKIK